MRQGGHGDDGDAAMTMARLDDDARGLADLPGPALLVDAQGCVRAATAEAVELFGDGDLTGMPLARLLSGWPVGSCAVVGGQHRALALTANRSRPVALRIGAPRAGNSELRLVVLQDISDEVTLAARAGSGGAGEDGPVGHFACDPVTGEAMGDAAWRTLLGLEADQGSQSSTDWFAHLYPEDRAKVRAAMAQAAHRATGGRCTYRQCATGGEAPWRHTVWLAGRRDAAGRVVTLIGATVAAAARPHPNTDLRRIVHDLRTPLTAIMGACALLGATEEATLTPDAQRLIQIAQENGERLSRMIDTLAAAGILMDGGGTDAPR